MNPNRPLTPRACLDAEGRIDAEITCVRCGYLLRTQAAKGACPECGSPVAASLAPDRLCFASPVTLNAVLNGLRMIFAAVLGFPLFTFCLGFTAAMSVGPLLGLVMWGGTILLFVVGVFFATRRDTANYLGAIAVARAGAVSLMVSWTLALALMFGEGEEAGLLFMFVMLACLAVTPLGLGLSLAGLAMRIPSPRLAKLARLLAISMGTVGGLATALLGFVWLVAFSRLDREIMVLAITAGVLWLVYAALALAGLVLLVAFHVAIGRVRKLAEAIRASQGPQPVAELDSFSL